MRRYLTKAYWQDKEIEVVMGNMLRIGVIISAVVTAIGGVMYLADHGGRARTLKDVFKSEPASFRSIPGVLHGVSALQSKDIVQLGVLLLIATPVARIVFSIFAFLFEKDYLYVFFTLIVLGIIIFSMLGGFA